MTSTPGDSKKLTLILCSRNDNYAGDSVGRLNISLNHAGDILDQHGCLGSSEIIVSDWGSEVPLAETLRLNDPAAEIVRFNYIDRTITESLPTVFSEVHALNSAARGSRGEFVGRIDQDILIGHRFVSWFFDGGVSSNKAYFSCRRDMVKNQPLSTFENSPLWLEDERKPNWYRAWFWRAAVGMFLIPRNIWWALGGYNEKNIQRGHMEQEFYFRLKSTLEVVDLGPVLDYDFYHLWHDLEEPVSRKMNEYLKLPELRSQAEDLCPNGDDWGLVNAMTEDPEVEQGSQTGLKDPTSREILNGCHKVLLIVINHSNAGFFAYVTFALNQLRHCEAHKLFPVVYFGPVSGKGRNAFHDAGHGDNTWDYYFEPVASLGYTDIKARLDDPGDPLSQDNVIQLTPERLWQLHKRDPDGIYNYPYGYFRRNKPGDLASWYDAQRSLAHGYVDRYVRVRQHIMDIVDQFHTSHLEGHKILGIHMRGSDKGTAQALPRLMRIVHPVEYFPEIDRYIDANGDCRIFLATDQQQFVEQVRDRYGDRLVVRRAQRASAFGDGANPFQKNSGSPYFKGEEVLVDCLLLARSDFLLKCTSAVGEYAMYFNPKLRCIDMNMAAGDRR